MFDDHSSNIIIQLPNKEIYGISINNNKAKYYAKTKEGFLKETQETDIPFVADITDGEDVSIKINER